MNVNGPHSLMVVKGVEEPFISEASLEAVGHWGLGVCGGFCPALLSNDLTAKVTQAAFSSTQHATKTNYSPE